MSVCVLSVSASLWSPDCSPPGSSVHGIFQRRILEWGAIPFSKGSSWPRDPTQVSCIADRFFTIWATREAQLRFSVLALDKSGSEDLRWAVRLREICGTQARFLLCRMMGTSIQSLWELSARVMRKFLAEWMMYGRCTRNVCFHSFHSQCFFPFLLLLTSPSVFLLPTEQP